ncbi:flavodoxin family protein [Clostridium bovifaecis]|uniref:Flavodoxin family protein n=1 Tax=Clostridium bovifaecis TaxID=2184719 RepID=A0A6I6F7B5_9CLOT|nr:flavodoxin family protein [Clostridium bovifaecis]
MKKIVAFIGSPRRNGNVSSIVNEVLRGAKENKLETKVYYLNEMNIKGCQSCLYCREHEDCCIQDDMQEIYEDIKNAEYLILGSPIYICQVSAQMKLLLDRFYPLTNKKHRPRFGIKKTVMVYSQAAPLSFIFKKYIRYNNKILKPMGIKTYKTIIATRSFTPEASKNNNKLMKKAYNIGKSLISTL